MVLPIAVLVLIAARLPAQQPDRYAIEPLGSPRAEGYIDWTQHALFAYGDGVAPAAVTNPVQQRLHGLRQARDEAFRTMRELIGQVRLSADTLLQDAGRERDFQEFARVAIGSQSEDQGRYRIAVRLLLLGDFAAAVLPQVEPVDPRSHTFPAAPAPADSLAAAPAAADSLAADATPAPADSLADDQAPVPADSLATDQTPVPADSLAADAAPTPADSLAADQAPAPTDSLAADELVFFVPDAPYTGLLIDVRGLGLQPSIEPQVFSAAGHLIHGVATVDRGLATDYGVAGYDDDLNRAYTSERLGGEDAKPFIVKATGTAGRYSGDAILDDFDAAQVLQADEAGDFLRQGRVTFLLGPAPAVFDSTFTSEGMEHELEFYHEMEPSDSPE